MYKLLMMNKESFIQRDLSFKLIIEMSLHAKLKIHIKAMIQENNIRIILIKESNKNLHNKILKKIKYLFTKKMIIILKIKKVKNNELHNNS